MKKWKLLITILLMFGCLITKFPVAALGNEEISGEIQVISNVAEAEMRTSLKAFSKKYPNIKVDYQCLSDYEGEIKTLINNGTYGDVLFIPGYIQSTKYCTYFSALGQYQGLSEKYNYLDISARSGDVIYGIPSSAYTTGILYNKDVFYYAGVGVPVH